MKNVHCNQVLTPVAMGVAMLTTILNVAYAANENSNSSAQALPPNSSIDASEGLDLDEIVITAIAEAKPKMRQSLSVSSLSSERITASGATSVAEILRSVPGVRAESSSGEGNSNVTVRGVPISAGGSRYVQFQEDGLPVLLFGDFNFLTPDMFIRADYGTEAVEVVRGGSASTLATNAAGGVINFISKAGADEDGVIGLTTNIGQGSSRRIDFTKGLRISDSSRLQLSGFMRNGEGFRDTDGVNMQSGGQIRAVLFTNLGGGNAAKLYFKLLNDKTPTQLTVPVRIVAGKIQAIDGIDPRRYSPYSQSAPTITDWGVQGSRNGELNNGLRSRSLSFGGEIKLNMSSGWQLNDKFRLSLNSGEFNGVMPDSYIGGNNPSSNTVSSYSALFLGAHFKSANVAVNDLKMWKSFQITDAVKVTSAFGLFAAHQDLDIDWEIGNFPGTTLDGAKTTYGQYNSLYAKNVNFNYASAAPYVNIGLTTGSWDIDASMRLDRQSATGGYTDTGTPPLGTIPVDYKSSLNSYSLGANYRVSGDVAVFARISDGGAFQSDRVAPGTGALGGSVDGFNGVKIKPNKVAQTEVGLKAKTGRLSTFVTLFQATANESNFDLTTNVTSTNKYKASGIELEAGYQNGGFAVNGGLTYTRAKVGESTNAAYVGLTPNRQAKVVYQLSPAYSMGPYTLGMTLVGTTRSLDAQTTALQAELPAYCYANLFASYSINPRASFSVSVKNAFNTLGYTEINTDRAAARSIDGRNINLTARYSF